MICVYLLVTIVTLNNPLNIYICVYYIFHISLTKQIRLCLSRKKLGQKLNKSLTECFMLIYKIPLLLIFDYNDIIYSLATKKTGG